MSARLARFAYFKMLPTVRRPRWPITDSAFLGSGEALPLYRRLVTPVDNSPAAARRQGQTIRFREPGAILDEARVEGLSHGAARRPRPSSRAQAHAVISLLEHVAPMAADRRAHSAHVASFAPLPSVFLSEARPSASILGDWRTADASA